MKWFIILGTFAFCYGGKVMEDPNLFEGDMELTKEQRQNIELSIKGLPTYAASTYPRWPNPVPYEIGTSLHNQPTALQAIRSAISELEAKSCLKFRYRTGSDPGYIKFIYGGGCSSPVGYYKRINHVKLAGGCWWQHVVVHEIMHSLGFYHEQSRPDRDSYVRILYNNIPRGLWYNFAKYGYGKVNPKGSPYDYYSIMHYDRHAFGGGRVTVEPYDTNMRSVIGRQKHLSKRDIEQLNYMYNCRGRTNTGTCKDKNPTNYCQQYRSYCTSSPGFKDGCRKTCGAC